MRNEKKRKVEQCRSADREERETVLRKGHKGEERMVEQDKGSGEAEKKVRQSSVK